MKRFFQWLLGLKPREKVHIYLDLVVEGVDQVVVKYKEKHDRCDCGGHMAKWRQRRREKKGK